MKKILILVFISLFLIISLSADTADEDTNISNVHNNTVDIPKNVKVVNDTYILPKNSGKAFTDGKIHTVKKKSTKKKKPKITMTGKPSCSRCSRNHCSYTWRTKTYLNYCPNCHHYNCLGNKYKWQSRHEQEITCFRCDSDFCINCGKEKYSWSHKYLIKG